MKEIQNRILDSYFEYIFAFIQFLTESKDNICFAYKLLEIVFYMGTVRNPSSMHN